LEPAGFGGAGGGLEGVRGDTYLDGDTLAIWPRDEMLGALLRRTIELGDRNSLAFKAGVDGGRAWHLVVFVNNDRVFDRLIIGRASQKLPERHWERVSVDLTAYKRQTVVVRLYDLVLAPNHYAGNSYWRHLRVD
jgi:hypothetical protein